MSPQKKKKKKERSGVTKWRVICGGLIPLMTLVPLPGGYLATMHHESHIVAGRINVKTGCKINYIIKDATYWVQN